jgi:DNA-binding transcriptional ArsR family regulator
VEIPLAPADLANTRLAFSPLWESVASYWALDQPSLHALHLPWIREAAPRFAELSTPRLGSLLAGRRTYPDFLTPAPETPLPDLEAELQRVVATSAGVVREDLLAAYVDLDPDDPGDLGPFFERPEQTVSEVADELAAYFAALLADVWPRMRALLEADVAHRARTLALEGPEALFTGLSPRLRWEDGVLRLVPLGRIDPPAGLVSHAQAGPGGQGLLLIPSVFVKAFVFSFGAHARGAIQYRARGVYQLWHPELPEASEGLEHLLGSSRARLLKQLAAPATPGELAHRLQVTPSAVSQQLRWLRDAGLVQTVRRGRHRSYELSHVGHALLAAYGDLVSTSGAGGPVEGGDEPPLPRA